jgi:hypothetical protein
VADRPAEIPAAVRLARTVVEVARPGNGRPNRATTAEIAERLHIADVDVSADELAAILQRLTDCGQLVQVQRSPSHPMQYASAGGWEFDTVDDLEASICTVLRGRDELGYEDEDQLREWLRDAGIECSRNVTSSWPSAICGA